MPVGQVAGGRDLERAEHAHVEVTAGLVRVEREAFRCRELQTLCGLEQPSLSQQLGVLRREGVVDTRREGKFIWYRLSDARALDLMQHIHRLFCAKGPQS